jgi:hypothetical protein
MDARNFFDQGTTLPFRRSQFGGTLGGPIVKNRLFYFGSYEVPRIQTTLARFRTGTRTTASCRMAGRAVWASIRR